jgi:hypothetical protein
MLSVRQQAASLLYILFEEMLKAGGFPARGIE